MKAIYIYTLLLVAVMPAAKAQNIYSGGISDGFSVTTMGFDIYAGGIANGFAVDSMVVAVPLPVTLVNFTAKTMGSQVRLYWQTDMETNNDHFEVERSADGQVFNWLTNVAGHGESQVLLDYQVMDVAPYAGINYYRLKQVDKDGRFKLSSIVSVNMAKLLTGSSISLYPNPVSQVLYINVTSTQNMNSMLLVYNAAGRQVAMQYKTLVKGENNFSLPISGLAPGIYYCRFENTDIEVKSFIKR